MKKPVVDPKAPRKVKAHYSALMFDPGDIVRLSKDRSYVRILSLEEVCDPSENESQHSHIEMTVEPCERPDIGLYVVGVLQILE